MLSKTHDIIVASLILGIGDDVLAKIFQSQFDTNWKFLIVRIEGCKSGFLTFEIQNYFFVLQQNNLYQLVLLVF
jgi:hypothetical protein